MTTSYPIRLGTSSIMPIYETLSLFRFITVSTRHTQLHRLSIEFVSFQSPNQSFNQYSLSLSLSLSLLIILIFVSIKIFTLFENFPQIQLFFFLKPHQPSNLCYYFFLVFFFSFWLWSRVIFSFFEDAIFDSEKFPPQ